MGERSVRNRLALLVPWVLLALHLVGSLFVAEPAWRPEWDGAVYLLTAGSLAAGEGYAYQGEPFFLRPPGLPWMLSFLVDGRAFDPWRVHLLLHACAGLAVAAVFLAVRGVHGRWLALAVALLAGTSAPFVQLLNWVFAEFPFAALLFAAIAALHAAAARMGADPAGRTDPRPRIHALPWALLGALLLAAAVHLRSVGVLLLPGVVLLFLVRGRGAGRLFGLVPALLACACVAPWWLHARRAAAEAEVPIEQDMLHDYGTALLHVDPGDPSSPRLGLEDWCERIASNGTRLLEDGVGSTLHVEESGLPLRAAFAVLVLIGVAHAVRRRGVSLLEWFFLAYVALLLVYFAYDPRLLFPLAPFLYLYPLVAVGALARPIGSRLRRPEAAAAGAVALASVLLLAGNARLLARGLRAEAWTGEAQKEMARWIRDHTPPDARILCNQAPVMALLTGRRTFTFRFVRSPDVLAKYDVDYVLFDAQPPRRVFELVRARRQEHWTIELGDEGRATIVRVAASGT